MTNKHRKQNAYLTLRPDRSHPFNPTERIKQVPIPEHPRRIFAHHPQRNPETKRPRSTSWSCASRRTLAHVQRSNCLRRPNARRKDEFDFENEKFAQGDREGESEKGTADHKGGKAANVLAGGGAETELRGGGEIGGEEQSERAGGARGGLDNVVFFGVNVAATEIARREGLEIREWQSQRWSQGGCTKHPPGLIEFATWTSKIEFEGRTLSLR